MLPLAERLRRSNLFTKVYGARKSVVAPYFTLYVLPRIYKTMPIKTKGIEKSKPIKPDFNRGNLPLAGFVVSKKTCKSACRRNKMKRRIREAYRLLRTQSLSQWYVMILVIKESALNAPWADLYRTMDIAFNEAARKYGRQ